MSLTTVSKALLLSTALLAACGSDSKSTNAPGGTQLAFVVEPSTCASQNQAVSVAGVVVGIADRTLTGACNALTTGCTEYKNLATLMLAVQNVDVTGAPVAQVGRGTYTVKDTPDSLSDTLVLASRNITDGNCADASEITQTASGTITLDSITSAAVKGSYDLTVNGTAYKGSFDAQTCTSSQVPVDLCSGDFVATCPTTPQCI